MKKLLIAAAAMAVVAGAQAQSSVTIYGGIDASYSNDKRGTNTAINNQMSNTSTDFLRTSAMGFRGTEDLGGGLSASFVYEADLASATGAQTLGNRQSHLVIASKQYGALSMGRQNDSVKDIEGLSQVYNLSDNLHFNTLVGNRYANVTKYQSPTIAGFKFAYSFSDNPAGDTITQAGSPATATSTTQEANATLTSYNLQYKAPINGGVDLAYGSGKVETGAATTTYTKTDIFTGRTVISGVTVGAAFIKNKQGDNKLDQTIASVNVPFMGAYELKAHYVKNKQVGSVITTPTGGSAITTQEGNAAGGDGFGVMAVYNLSKRTSAYAGFADFSGDVATYDRKTTTVGLFHAF